MTLLPQTSRFRRIASRAPAAICLLFLAACASGPRDTSNPDWAQAGSPPPPSVTSSDADWKETDVPPPPAFSQDRLVPIEMPPYMSLKFGVDPATIAITHDGVVRYVVVATNRSGGAVNAFYEGVRCSTDEKKTYARYNNGKWEEVPHPDWTRFGDQNSRYTQALASQGVCRDHAPRASVSEMIGHMRNPIREVQ